MVRAGDLASEAELLFEFPAALNEVSEKAQEVLMNGDSLAVLRAARDWVDAHQGVGEDSFAEMVGDLKRETGRKGKALLLPLRVGLTGRISGPELGKLLPVIDIGSRLPLERPVASCLHRLGEMVRFLSGSG